MIKLIRVLVTVCVTISAVYLGAMTVCALSGDDIYSETAILIDAQTGQVLFDKNMNKRMYPASTTKIMTGILALENAYPGETLLVSEEAVGIWEPDSSNIALTSGEELTLDSAMYALMLQSANDAANVIAEYISGSQDDFVKLMNQKARLIGAEDTNFRNAHGLHDDGHYTTAYDLALITRYATENELFMRYFGAETFLMPSTNKQPIERPFTNYQYMLLPTSRFYYEGVIGGKTGYTNPARHTMSTVAEKDGRKLICVVMGSANRDEKFIDTKKLLDFGFNEFTEVTVPLAKVSDHIVPVREDDVDKGRVLFETNLDFTFLLHNSVSPKSVRFKYDTPEFFNAGNRNITGSVSLIALSEEANVPAILLTRQLDAKILMYDSGEPLISVMADTFQENDKASSPNVLIKVVGCVAAFVILLAMYRRHTVIKRRKDRMRRLSRRLREAEVAAINLDKTDKPKKIAYRTSYWT